MLRYHEAKNTPAEAKTRKGDSFCEETCDKADRQRCARRLTLERYKEFVEIPCANEWVEETVWIMLHPVATVWIVWNILNKREREDSKELRHQSLFDTSG